MQKSQSIGVCVVLALSLCLWHFPAISYAQFHNPTNTPSNTTPVEQNVLVSVNSTVTLPVTNQTFKSNQGTLRSVTIDLINAGPDVLKTSDENKITIQTKITNHINNDTQVVQGVEATNAIIGVEINKGLTGIVSSTHNQSQGGIVTIQISSTCKQTAANSIFCENTLVLK
jgi:hypothetical protein